MARIDCITAQQLAAELVKKAGFVLFQASQVSESCYYEHPSRPRCLLRLSTHKHNGSPIGLGNVLVCLSFTEKDEAHLLTPTIVKNRTIWAIGYYFLADVKVSKYKPIHVKCRSVAHEDMIELP